MSNFAPEQLFATQKAAVDTLFGLTFKAFEGFEKLVELNLQVVKSTLAENQEVVGKALSAKDPQGFFALQTPPTTEKLQSYWRHVSEIVTGTQGEFTAAAEVHFNAFDLPLRGAHLGSLHLEPPALAESAQNAKTKIHILLDAALKPHQARGPGVNPDHAAHGVEDARLNGLRHIVGIGAKAQPVTAIFAPVIFVEKRIGQQSKNPADALLVLFVLL